MTRGLATYAPAAILALALPFLGGAPYVLHIVITILIWSIAYTGWSIMGRFGLVSLGHGAYMTIGAYGVALLWNKAGVTPWIGIPASVALAALVGAVIGWPCFRMRIVGHYFALVTLALTEVVRLLIMAMRDDTGGSLGYTPKRFGDGSSLYALQTGDKVTFCLVALAAWVAAIWVWRRIDRSMARYALEAIADDETAAAAVGVRVTRTKLMVTVVSAAMTAFAGCMYCQYQMYVNPESVGGIGVSLQMAFAVIAGGMYAALGPTVGAVVTIVLSEGLRLVVGTSMVGLDNTIYGVMLILFIIFMPSGLMGGLRGGFRRTRRSAGRPRPAV